MNIIIIGIILFIVECYIIKNTKSLRTNLTGSYYLDESTELPVKLKIWQWVLLIAGNMGYLCIGTAIIFIIIYIKKACKSDNYYRSNCTYWRFKSPIYTSTIKFLNKEL
jgi:hypothetical protein